MPALVVALLALLIVSPPQHEIEILFSRSVTSVEASRIVLGLAPEAEVVEATFEPLAMGVGVESPPTAGQVDALFTAGAISVETLNLDAQFASIGLTPPDASCQPDTPEGRRLREAIRKSFGSAPRYSVSVSFPGHWASSRAQDAVELTLGTRPKQPSKTANVMRVRVASGDIGALRQRLEAHSEVVATTLR